MIPAASQFLRLFCVGMVLWALCTGLQAGDAWAGVFSAGAFALCGMLVFPARHAVRLRALPGFLFYFVFHSLRSGFHVARLALDPQTDLAPGWTSLTSRLPAGPPRAAFAALVGLLPGTLCADVQGEVHEVHLLHRGVDPTAELRDLETQVARLFGVAPGTGE